MILDLLAGNPLVRRAADAMLVRYARRRTAELDRVDVPSVQKSTLLQLLHKSRDTRFGRDHGFDRITTVQDYQAAVPVRTYEDFWTGYWQGAFPRLEGATWPDFIPYYALSSGTTGGTTKYIPLTREMLASNKKAAYTTMALFRDYAPKASVFNGRIFFMGGNTDLRRESNGSRSGDLSAISAIEVTRWSRPYTFPPRELSSIADWTAKVRPLAETAARMPITAISGVPSWMQLLFKTLKEVTGKSRVIDVWPKLKLVIHGGTKFDPYRESFRADLGPDVRFLDVYPASEGFVATEDPRYNLLRVVPDHDIFFEFVPTTEFENGKLKTDRPTRHTLETVEVGPEYAVVLTTCAGLWAYQVGDTIAFERRDPPLIRFTGRTKYFLSAFGEHLISEEINKAVAAAAHETDATAGEFHVGPVFSTDPRTPGHHRYLIQFVRPPADLNKFTDVLDTTLRRLNEDYDAHRHGDLTMLRPEVVVVKPDAFLRWMVAHGRRLPQGKVPEMDNTGEQTKAITAWLKEHGELAT
ncbi:MAG TPA: GH3 auxin-responsive promoter family protein [Gemmataceae bacterium]|nr:GH3 auxin-responsive promoter family protein [Gemmataceae bacterium]